MKNLLFIFIILFCSCQSIDLNDNLMINNYQETEQGLKTDTLIYEDSILEIYLYKEYYPDITINSIPTLPEGYRLPIYEEALILHQIYIPYTQRCLCTKENKYYTFFFNNEKTISWAREGTRYTVWPVKVIYFNQSVTFETTIDQTLDTTFIEIEQ